ncbi:uncharacterized protein L969DRAFT_96574 [Mixia osmundae IAM 14324]|uniref:Uncharacterized protein n=1 Tax=Mixia osmundae (strain CBS 9802 / IAM 14324 / JCM 22182 / KY 12970) TaxID=764103 RepID=G7EAU7_MIXOS|nr:uncharacterized protein L969DRAFT_96574 [Mixia osmundae IAM 14324]KEI36991.1 hypothetical protein L969DRAFT_96574 [Mixia osmundae IAM 14324]GAA99957.1 hypothetical protein E5Q_06660 [Mixia osmundae IAM 14324]
MQSSDEAGGTTVEEIVLASEPGEALQLGSHELIESRNRGGTRCYRTLLQTMTGRRGRRL